MIDLGILARQRIHLIRQTEIAECGLAAVTMVANFHGLRVDLGSMRRRFASSLRGSPIRSLISVADAIGLTARAVKLPLEQLASLHMPAILHWDMNHYVVLERVRHGRALIHDPSGRTASMSLKEVSPHFTGVALELRVNHSFEKGAARERLRLRQLWTKMTGLSRALIQVVLLSFVLQAFVLASPYYMQIAIDNAIPALDLSLLTVLAVGFGLFTFITSGAALLRAFVLLVAGTTLGTSIASNVTRRLFRLPIDWFEKRQIGDILSRYQSIGPIQNMLTQGAIAPIIDGTMALLTLTLMLFYSPLLTLITLIAFSVYVVVRTISFRLEREAKEASIVAQAKEQTMLMETIRGITTLRLFSRETMRHTLWLTRLYDAANAQARADRVGIWQSSANNLIFGTETIISVYIAIGFVIKGLGFSVGMVFAFMAYKTQFLVKAVTLIDQLVAFRMLGLHLERLSDIALGEEDRSFGETSSIETPLEGRVEFREVSFRYGPGDPLILKSVSFIIEAGEHIAITGPSGGGKSTLVKLLLGLLEPDSGEILVDGLPLSRFGVRSFHEQTSAVLQDDRLFAGSLADNIALFDEQIDMDHVVQAAKAAAIHNDISLMPMRYETLVGDMGSTLSGGQKQRVFLARALYRQPRLLVLDEATSHLDEESERMVNKAIDSLPLTRVVVAHRTQTINAADRVIIV